MRTLFLTLILTLAFGFVQFVEARTDETLSVRINQQKTLARSKLTIKFVSLVEDSRCPADVNCIWAGNAKIQIRVSKGRESKTFELNTNLEPRIVTFAGYEIKLAGVSPSPRSNVKINRNGYTASLAVAKLAN